LHVALLRDSKTGLYWGGGRRWLKEPTEAFHFPTIPEAVRNASRCGVEEVNVVLKFYELECEIRRTWPGRMAKLAGKLPLGKS
jgi:hypothetical protein